MNRMKIIVLMVAGLLIAAGCLGGGGDNPTNEVVSGPSGKVIYETNCLACHGATGIGDGSGAIGIDPQPADFTDGEWKYGGSLTEIENTIRTGSAGTAMVPWENILSEEEIKRVAAYVKSIS